VQPRVKRWIKTHLTTAQGARWGFVLGAVVSVLSAVIQFWPYPQTVASFGGGYWAALPAFTCLSVLMGSYLLGLVFGLLRLVLSGLAAGELADDPSGDYFDDIPWL
jgi:hypothetical protein